ncbi:outer membrane lipid asymmetry maintenance protein MlaD [Acetobacter sp.]|jgi:phospholipid/cholesterol/gamma-HCH transport system substrate-binding protein|uniref:outer membrane lipid asymmetry maintenance protein MlaD n=1 Tax=Acetobacter sp. TaxID=440 RepID=UPI0025C736D7|nr:outer membrane lipid asymmetry maintenance protein MlaD [Acetobacter sp.]MCH4091428.1 outer membrane lipid asymmetry maintenance protein MlaD [Acetobacter sp.]MCI1299406.1 outer membrane lipid asymmetry maintenance protein MlaD [Acetobacter sp.]MCI1316590.1 outer membrane lipid asymmetry maintenance protein MlaD [Acetobacter sp.]
MSSVSTTSRPAEALSPLRRTRSTVELLAGFAVIIAFVLLLGLAVVSSGRKTDAGYQLRAGFSHIDGLDIGSAVKLAGISIGHVVSAGVDPKTFQAEVVFTVRPDVQLPVDSAAIITSDSLLGGKYIAISPGGDTKNLKAGGEISETQGSISLEQLLSKFIFSVTDTLTQANQAKAKKEMDAPKGETLP